jgi:hypothetical protein
MVSAHSTRLTFAVGCATENSKHGRSVPLSCMPAISSTKPHRLVLYISSSGVTPCIGAGAGGEAASMRCTDTTLRRRGTDGGSSRGPLLVTLLGGGAGARALLALLLHFTLFYLDPEDSVVSFLSLEPR